MPNCKQSVLLSLSFRRGMAELPPVTPTLRLNLAVNGRHRLFSPSKSQHYSSSSRWRLQVPLAVRRLCLPRPNQVGDSPVCCVNCLWFRVCYWLYALYYWQRRSCSTCLLVYTSCVYKMCLFLALSSGF